jgi:hypothetical protein
MRSLIERIVFDSPDQFVLAQLRGASYYTIGRNVRPAEELDSEDYSGPVWDIVRVDEPSAERFAKPNNQWRLYYINSVTGLMDRVVSREEGDPIVAEISNWVSRQGELLPASITWKLKGQTVMEFMLDDASYGSKQ